MGSVDVTASVPAKSWRAVRSVLPTAVLSAGSFVQSRVGAAYTPALAVS